MGKPHAKSRPARSALAALQDLGWRRAVAFFFSPSSAVVFHEVILSCFLALRALEPQRDLFGRLRSCGRRASSGRRSPSADRCRHCPAGEKLLALPACYCVLPGTCPAAFLVLAGHWRSCADHPALRVPTGGGLRGRRGSNLTAAASSAALSSHIALDRLDGVGASTASASARRDRRLSPVPGRRLRPNAGAQVQSPMAAQSTAATRSPQASKGVCVAGACRCTHAAAPEGCCSSLAFLAPTAVPAAA